MKIIDLLNKIANKEQVPEKIKYENKIWEYDVYSNDYKGENIWLFEELFEYRRTIEFINDEVEIIEEEKEISKITMRAGLVGSVENKIVNLDINIMAVEDKINELIDEINNLKGND